MNFDGWSELHDDSAPTAPLVRIGDLFDREHGFMPSMMGEMLLAECRVVVGEGGQLYRYLGGVYRNDGEEWAASRVRDLLGERFKRRHRDETLAWFSSQMAIETATPPVDFLNVKNGLLSWDGSALKPHTPDFVSTVQIPVDWNTRARCERILGFLRDVLPDEETVRFVLEVIGYCLFPRNTMHVAILLRGPGRNGKSVLLAIIGALLGERNIAAVPLQQFAENRFAAASLVGKLANICGDLDARAITRTDLFKMLTGGDLIHTERKYGDAFSFRSFALPIFSANEPPQSSDQSEAWFERWLVVPMEKTIAPEARDPNLIAKLTTTDEIEGLLVEAVKALGRLRERGHFEIPAAVQAARDDYRERLDSVSSFVTSDLQFGPAGYVTRSELAKAYRDHCRELDLHPVPTGRLYDRVRAADPGVGVSKRNGTRGFVGVSVR
jgi:putative DNA primase/helicase